MPLIDLYDPPTTDNSIMDVYAVNHREKIAKEKKKSRVEKKDTQRYWLAIWISIAALVVSIIALLR